MRHSSAVLVPALLDRCYAHGLFKSQIVRENVVAQRTKFGTNFKSSQSKGKV